MVDESQDKEVVELGKPLYRRGYPAMQETFIKELGLNSTPIAIKFFYGEIEVDYFTKWHENIQSPQGISFCESVIRAIGEGHIYLLQQVDLSCTKALQIFNWAGDASSTVERGKLLQKGAIAVAIAPLGSAQFVADIVLFSGDAEAITRVSTEWSAVAGIQAEQDGEGCPPQLCENTVFVHNQNIAKIGTSLSCNESDDKGSPSLHNIAVPGDHLKHLSDHLAQRSVGLGPSPLSRPGDGFFRYTIG